jgi:hypothetical protein
MPQDYNHLVHRVNADRRVYLALTLYASHVSYARIHLATQDIYLVLVIYFSKPITAVLRRLPIPDYFIGLTIFPT